MTRRSKSPDEKLATITRVEALIGDGMSRHEAYVSVGISRAQFYRYRRELGGKVLPAVRLDWQATAATWDPDGLGEIRGAALMKLRREVAAELQTVFGRPVVERAHNDRHSLRAFAGAFAKACEGYAALGDGARAHLEELHEPTRLQRSFATLFEAAAALRQDLDAYLGAWAEQARELGESGSGPQSDPRVPILVTALASLFAKHGDQIPTHTFNPEDGLPSSRFNHFVASIRRHFLSDPAFSHLTDNAFNEAMRHTAARLDFSSDQENNV